MSWTASLASLRELDVARRIFGARQHQYRLNRPVDAATLARAEQHLCAQLPSGYRRFLETSNGGAGPYWGVLSLEDALARVEATCGSLAPLESDFPLRESVDFSALCGRPDDHQEHLARLAADPRYATRWDECQATYLAEPFCNGKLPLVDYGCGDWFFLVVRGPARGQVWVDSLDSCSGLFSLGVDFETFYRTWLEDAARRLERGDFAPGRGFLEFAAPGVATAEAQHPQGH